MNSTVENYIAQAREGLSLQTTAHAETWHLGEESDWSADLDSGTIVWTFTNGSTATAAIQVVGTYNTSDKTFLWGWDHPSVPIPLRDAAEQAKRWGEVNAAIEFIERKVVCTEDDAWSFSAVTNRLARTNGVYRGPAGPTLVFMAFGEVKLSGA